MKKSASILVLTMAASLAAQARAADVPQGAKRLTDPAILASLGYAPGAAHVYAVPERLNQPLGLPGETQEYFGTTVPGFSTYPGQSFKPQRIDAIGNFWGTLFQSGDICFFGDNDATYEVLLADIPDGARLQAVRWWAYDEDASQDLVFSVDRVCQPHLGPGFPQLTILGSQSTVGAAGNQSGEISIDTAVDTKTCLYRARVTFTEECFSHVLYKVRAQWVRQVSPAPATARFLDVPTGHPFFRFVEALAASGITGGCSANQFCPDSPLTRGQMAAFLATALGLSWGGL